MKRKRVESTTSSISTTPTVSKKQKTENGKKKNVNKTKKNVRVKKNSKSNGVVDIEDLEVNHFPSRNYIEDFRDSLLEWYQENKRELPWRHSETNDLASDLNFGYKVWVSEIMLQQTRVDTVIDYFNKWMAKFPTVLALSQASLEDVNQLWAGLGYYRRAKFLHSASQMVQSSLSGTLPSYEGITSATMELLNCHSINGRNYLFTAGEVQCYTYWQYQLFGILLLFLIPFPFFLILIRMALKSKTVIAMKFEESAEEALDVLEAPYSNNVKWWETFGLARRLGLLSIYVFVADSLYNAVGLFALCAIVLGTHLYFSPLKDKRYNSVETVFLTVLMLLSGLKIAPGTYSHLGKKFDNPFIVYLEVGFISFAVVYAIAVFIFVRFTSLFSKCRAILNKKSKNSK